PCPGETWLNVIVCYAGETAPVSGYGVSMCEFAVYSMTQGGWARSRGAASGVVGEPRHLRQRDELLGVAGHLRETARAPALAGGLDALLAGSDEIPPDVARPI